MRGMNIRPNAGRAALSARPPARPLLSPPGILAAAAALLSLAWPLAAEAASDSVAPVGLATLPHDLSPWGMVESADIVVKLVMIGLVLASIATWTVLLAKGLELAAARRRMQDAIARLGEATTIAEAFDAVAGDGGTAAALVEAAALELQLSNDCPGDGIKDRTATRLERIAAASGRRMARGIGLLATIGSTAPFVGLFGTVWGIMDSFVGIARAQTTNLAVVAPGIAEALLATAIGLIAAIPAVVIYNGFSRAIGTYRAQVGDAASEVLRLLSRDLDRQPLLRDVAG
jgi:biopolymer transport protein ExbB